MIGERVFLHRFEERQHFPRRSGCARVYAPQRYAGADVPGERERTGANGRAERHLAGWVHGGGVQRGDFGPGGRAGAAEGDLRELKPIRIMVHPQLRQSWRPSWHLR